MTATMTRVLTIATVLVAVGCNDLSTPQELSHPQILAVRADPPIMPAGARSQLSVLVAGPDGEVQPEQTDWAVADAIPGVPPVGAIETDDDGVWFVAPAATDGVVGVAVQVTVRLADASSLVAIKGIGVGAPNPTANPSIDEVRIGDEAAAEDVDVRLARGAVTPISVAVAPGPGPDAEYSWYATIGEIGLYRRNPSEIIAPEDAGTGWLYAVYRDGAGGVAWRRLPIVVE